MLSKERADEVVAYIREHYSLKALVTELGIWNGGPTTIKCPLHADSRPSFSMDFEANVYQCFSCGSRGSYLNLLHDYMTKVQDDGKGFYTRVEELLKSDAMMQKELGYDSIFITAEQQMSMEDVLHMEHQLYQPVYSLSKSYQIIANRLRNNTNLLLDYYADVEQGLSLDLCWKKYIEGKPLTLEETLQKQEEYKQEFADFFDEEDEEDEEDALDKAKELKEHIDNVFTSDDEDEDIYTSLTRVFDNDDEEDK